VIIGVLLLYTINDDGLFDKNQCERKALKEIAESKDTLVRLNTNCSVLSWDTIFKPEDIKLNSKLLMIWHITKERKSYSNH
jgi:phage/plasmid-associated DNA primase